MQNKIKQVILILGILMISTITFAQSQFMCWPHEKATRFFVEQIKMLDKPHYTLHVTNPMGYDYMPQLSGPVSKAQIDLQKTQIDDLKVLGDHFDITWSADQCELDKKAYTLDCHGEIETSADNIKALSLKSTLITEKSKNETYEKVRYSITLDKEGSIYNITLEYFIQSCKAF